MPLLIEDRIFGVLELTFPDGRLFSPAQIAFAELLASMLAIASLEAKNFAQQQEYTWINTVLLEVAKHAAQPGDPETALRAVLQLTTLLAGRRWAALLLPEEAEGLASFGSHVWALSPCRRAVGPADASASGFRRGSSFIRRARLPTASTSPIPSGTSLAKTQP